MYHLTKDGVSVELGAVMSGTNPEHVGNCHVFVQGFGHIRGIVIYKKVKNGQEEILLKLPGYRKSKTDKYETAYMNLEPKVADVVFEAVCTVPKENYSRYYTGQKVWSVWCSSVPKTERHNNDEEWDWAKDPDEGAH